MAEDVQEMITCLWCDELTAAGAPCGACGGDPTGPVTRTSGLAAVRERRLEARQAMLAARRGGSVDALEAPPFDHDPGAPAWGPPAPETRVNGAAPAPPSRSATPGAAQLAELTAAAAAEAAWAPPRPPAPQLPGAWQTGPPPGASQPPPGMPLPVPPGAPGPLPAGTALAGVSPAALVGAPPPMGGPPWGLVPARRSGVGPIVAAIAIPVVLVAMIGVGISVVGRKSSPATAVNAAPAASAPPTTELGPSSGRPWVAFHGPNFTASFPSTPVGAQDSMDCTCGSKIPIRAWESVEGLTSYYVTEMTIPSDLGVNPDDVIDGMVSSILQDSNVTISAAPPSQVGPYQVRDVKITGVTYGASARVMVGTGTIWILVGRASANQPPDWVYFLRKFAPSGQPLSPRSTTGSGAFE